MHSFVPFFVSRKYSENCFNGSFTATAMFVDIAGFTRMTQSLMNNGKEGAEVLAGVVSLAHEYGGYFNKICFTDTGGMILVLFGAPLNQGNLYQRALDFALAVTEIPDFGVCIGMAGGNAFTGFVGSDIRREYTAMGSVVNLSSRLSLNCDRTSVRVDKEISRRAGSQYLIRRLKPGRLKGFKEPVPVFSLAGRRSTGVLTVHGRMIGRDTELNKLTRLIQPVLGGKFGGVVYIYGFAGAGKTRLVSELADETGICTFVLQPDSILRKPLNPVVSFLGRYFELEEWSSPADRREKFNSVYHKFMRRIEHLPGCEVQNESVIALRRIKSIIAALVGLFQEGSVYDVIDSRERAAVTEQAVKEFFKALSLLEPVILLVEDIQWLDSATADFFQILTRKVDNFPIIIIACSRFNDDGSSPEFKLDEGVPCCSIILEQLPEHETRELIEASVQ